MFDRGPADPVWVLAFIPSLVLALGLLWIVAA